MFFFTGNVEGSTRLQKYRELKMTTIIKRVREVHGKRKSLASDLVKSTKADTEKEDETKGED